MLEVSNGTTIFIDSKISTLQGLKELVDISTNFSLDFSVTIVETEVILTLSAAISPSLCRLFAKDVVQITQHLLLILSKQGLFFLHLENFARSRQCFTDALEIFTGTFGAIHPDVLQCNASLARLEWLDGCE